MATAEEYRRHAAECVRLARKNDDLREKDVLLQMAEGWRKLAAWVEQEDEKR